MTFLFSNRLQRLACAVTTLWAVTCSMTSAQDPGGTSAPLNRVSTIPESGGLIVLSVPAAPSDGDLSSFQGMIEPLRPVADTSTSGERNALAQALNTWSARPVAEDMSALQGFVSAYPGSVWTPSLYLNLGRFHYNTGYFSKAMEDFLAGWNLTREMQGVHATTIANASMAEYAVMLARVGRKDELSALLTSTADRTFQGVTANVLERAKEGLWNMENRPGISFRCGPYALNAIYSAQHGGALSDFVKEVDSPVQGFSLAELKTMAASKLSASMQVAKRSVGAPVILPSLVHWKVGHYGALMREQDGVILLRDPTFGNDTWMTRAAVDAEASGYFLVPAGTLPEGWTAVSDSEASTIYGKGHSGNSNGSETQPCAKKSGTTCPNPHMAGYSFHTLLASLNITDIPVGYTPAYGPNVDFEVTYNMKEAAESATGAAFTNTSPLWVCNWVSYLVDDTSAPATQITIYTRGGGSEVHTGYTTITSSPPTGSYARNNRWNTVLVRTGANSYERLMQDGSKEVYSQAIGTGSTRKVFLTKVVDPQGNAVTLLYSTAAGLTTRLESIVDATGLVTTLAYTESGSPFLVTKVTDPFTRYATFSYTTIAGVKKLQKISDTMGLESSFEYNNQGQVMAMTTPYGRTTFEFGSPHTAYGLARWIDAVDPLGNKERLEYHMASHVTGIGSSVPSVDVPQLTGYGFTNSDLDDRNTFYWSKKAWAMAPGDYSKAHVQHWIENTAGSDISQGILESEKLPYESRVWYRYDGQPNYSSYTMGTSSQPNTIARVIENASGGRTSQVTRMSYNGLGNILTMTDPVGRESAIEYESNGVDPKAVKQKVNGEFKIIQSFTYDAGDPVRRPHTIKDAAGQTTTFTYVGGMGGTGQLETVTNALGQRTTLNYGTDTGNFQNEITPYYPKGKIKEIIGPDIDVGIPGPKLTVSYDSRHRPMFVNDWSNCTPTNPSPYTLRYRYDEFDRITLITYPDGTTEEFDYGWVDPASPAEKKAPLDLYGHKDRQGRWTRTWHNALRQPVLTADALGRTLQFEWCKCGSLQKLTDGKNQITSWKYDAQGRNYQKTYPDNRTESITYEPLSGRVATTTDAAQQIKTYKYFADGNLESINYSNLAPATSTAPGTAATHSVSYTYDPNFPRPTKMTDGTGVTNFDFYPASRTDAGPDAVQLGAMRLKSIDGPILNTADLITYTYDELGQLKTNNIGAAVDANLTTRNYDSLGRIEAITNRLGNFGYSYVEKTGRIREITYPNDQTTTFDYHPSSDLAGGNGDYRLKTITHTRPVSAGVTETLSQYDYTYLKDGNISTWQKQLGAALGTATRLTLGYDSVDQLTSAILAPAAAPNVASKTYSYQYDKAGNRTNQQSGSMVGTATHTSANRITDLNGGGKFLVSGTTDEPAKVKVNGQPATTGPAPTNLFQAWLELSPGTHTITVEATDYASPPNATTPIPNWSVSVTSNPARSFSYDGNGNTLGDGVRTYQWDAENRLVKITKGVDVYEFTYDGFSRRVEEKVNGSPSKCWIWEGTRIAEQRTANGTTVQRRYYSQGEERIGGTDVGNYYYTRDHLGSIREVVKNVGVTNTLVTRYDYDPYGGRTKLTGDFDCDFGFTGHHYHAGSDLHLTLYRAYEQGLGRWLSADPIGEEGGMNLYRYANNSPAMFVDPDGRHPILIIAVILAYFGTTENLIAPSNTDDMSKQFPAPGIAKASQALFPGVGLTAPAKCFAYKAAEEAAERMFINEGYQVLAAVSKDGKLLAYTYDLGLSHAEFITRKLGGVLPEGAYAVTIGKYKGQIHALLSNGIHQSQGMAPQFVQDVAKACFR